ncbi:MAG: hypothetical protein IKU36_09355 [Bacteroidales bacterium]|nr:hypothetical protein [Bacteroidales bacterium]
MKFKYLYSALAIFGLLMTSCETPEQPGIPENPEEQPAEITMNNGEVDVINVDAERHELSISFTTNYEWTISNDAEWISISPVTGTAGDTTIKVVVMQNDGSERTASIVISCNDASKSIQFIQAAVGPGNDDDDDDDEEIVKKTYVVFGCSVLESYCLGLYDTDKDGGIEVGTEALDVDEIILPEDMSISSLKGIEYFPNLKTITFHNGQNITEADFSANTKLMSIAMYSTNIAELDLSSNPLLYSFELYDNERLRSLDFSSNENLMIVKLFNCINLASLDVSANPNLDILSCISCSLTDIDVSGSPSLRFLECPYNFIEVLDISANPALAILSVTPMLRDNDLKYIILSDENQLDRIESKLISPSTEALIKDHVGLSVCSLELEYTQSVFEVTAKSVVPVEISSMPSWVNFKRKYSLDAFTTVYQFVALSNLEQDVREGQLVFMSADGKTTESVYLTQQYLENTISFIDSTIESVCLSLYDADGNGKISVEKEAPAVTSIEIDNVSCDISLYDIRHFPNLEMLHINGGNIYDADLTHNGKLEFISIINTSLSELELSGNPELKTLHCHHNEMRVLDVSSNKVLKELSASPMKNGKELEYLIVPEGASFDVSDETVVIERGTFRLASGSIELTHELTIFDVTVISTEYSYATTDANWIRMQNTVNDLADNYMIKTTFVAVANKSGAARSADIIIMDAESREVARFTVHQADLPDVDNEYTNQDILPGDDIIM